MRITPIMGKAALLVLALLLASFAYLSVRRDAPLGDRAPVLPSPLGSKEEGLAPKRTIDSREEPSSDRQDAEPVSTAQFLQDFWGERWPEIESGIRGVGGDLSALVDPDDIGSWEEVAPLIQKSILGGGLDQIRSDFQNYLQTNLDRDKLKSKYGEQLDSLQLDELADLAATYQFEIDQALDELAVANLVFRQGVWDQKRYAVGPIYSVDETGFVPSVTGMMSTTGSIRGWSYLVDLDPRHDFNYESAMKKTMERTLVRRRAVRSYVRGVSAR